jgi:hypothetical protein
MIAKPICYSGKKTCSAVVTASSLSAVLLAIMPAPVLSAPADRIAEPHPSCAQPSPIRTTAAQFPPITAGQSRYVVCPDQTKLHISRLVLPDGFTIAFDPRVGEVDWVVDEIVIQGDATIDLRPQLTPPPDRPQRPPMKQQAKCHGGVQGGQGYTGKAGLPGTNLTIRDVLKIENSGSLWIRTDGQNGGRGGKGQTGQQGGGPRGYPFFGCQDRPGGEGGPGGAPGPGGAAAAAKIVFRANVGNPPISGRVLSGCGITPRPRISGGLIAISGRPGCPGGRGDKGDHGPHG